MPTVQSSLGTLSATAFVALLTLSAQAAPGEDQRPAAGATSPTPPATPPPFLDVDPAKYAPPGYHLELRPRRGLQLAGGIVLVIGYAIPIAVTAGKSQGQSYYYLSSNELPFGPELLFMPVLGPWLALADLKSYDCSNPPAKTADPQMCRDARRQVDIWRTVFIVDGLVQLSGAALLILGQFWPWQQFVINNTIKAQVAPVRLSASGHGVALVGTFAGP